MNDAPPSGATSSPAKTSWADLGPRLISAIVLIFVVASSLQVGGYLFALVVGVAFALTYREWDRMVTLRPLSVIGAILIVLVGLSALAYPLWGWQGTAVFLALAIVVAGLGGLAPMAWRIGGIIFFGAVILAVMTMRGNSVSGIFAGWFLGIVVALNDTGAYFVGRLVGGEKLAPLISPAKTWSGAIGGWLIGAVAGTVFWAVFIHSPLWIGALLAACMGLIGQVGDLTESAIKRRFRIKDSGDIVPGHGGLMDRLDSITFGVLFLFVVGALHGGLGDVAGGFLNW